MSIIAAQIDQNGLVINNVVVEEQDFLSEYNSQINIVAIPFANSTDGEVVSYLPVVIKESKYINGQFMDLNDNVLTINFKLIDDHNKKIAAWQTPPEVY